MDTAKIRDARKQFIAFILTLCGAAVALMVCTSICVWIAEQFITPLLVSISHQLQGTDWAQLRQLMTTVLGFVILLLIILMFSTKKKDKEKQVTDPS